MKVGDLVVWHVPPPEPTEENPEPGEGSVGVGYVKRVVTVTESGQETEGAWVGLFTGPLQEHFVPESQVVVSYSGAVADRKHMNRELLHVQANRQALGWKDRKR